MKTCSIGKITITTEMAGFVAGNTDGLKKYDVVASVDDHVIKASYGCIGDKAVQYWEHEMFKFAERLIILMDALQMAKHNERCYRDKEGFKYQHGLELAKAKVLSEWIYEMTNILEKDNPALYY